MAREWAWYPLVKSPNGKHQTGELTTELGQKHAEMILVEKKELDKLTKALKVAINAMIEVNEWWTDGENRNGEFVVEVVHREDEMYPNDSMAAGSIIKTKNALKKVKQILKDGESNG